MRWLHAAAFALLAASTSGLRKTGGEQSLEGWPRLWRQRGLKHGDWVHDGATYQSPSVQNWTNGSLATPAFRNVLLVVHCRGGEFAKLAHICKEREWISRQYAPHFGDVFYMTKFNFCKVGSGDPHVCLANLMETRGAKRDGILYIHFDALINPRTLAVGFNTSNVASFESFKAQPLNQHLDQVNWKWPHYKKKEWQKALNTMGSLITENRSIYEGVDDLFYIPRAAFKLYAPLAKGFANAGVFHEIVGPTIRTYTARQLNLTMVNLRCAGSRTTTLRETIATNNSRFTCGHRFNMGSPTLQLKLANVING